MIIHDDVCSCGGSSADDVIIIIIRLLILVSQLKQTDRRFVGNLHSEIFRITRENKRLGNIAVELAEAYPKITDYGLYGSEKEPFQDLFF